MGLGRLCTSPSYTVVKKSWEGGSSLQAAGERFGFFAEQGFGFWLYVGLGSIIFPFFPTVEEQDKVQV